MTTPRGFSLGDVTGHVDINPSGVRTGLDQAKRQLNSFRQDMSQWVQNTGRQVRNFGAAWTAAAAPIGLALGAGINAAANFDEALIEIQARTGLTADAMNQVRETALQLGADTVFSTQQAADAFLQLLTAGLSAEEALATLPNVLDAAAAGGLDLGTSADIITNVMSAFNLTAEESTQIIEAMSRAAASSPANMLQVGEAMQRAGGMARSLGLDVNRTSAILAILAQNGLRGSEAGTQLNSMLRNMTRNTPSVQQAWDDLGVSLFDAQGNMRDLDTVFNEIGAAMANMSMEDQNRISTDLAGSYGRLGFSALLASDGIAEMETTMLGQASASEVAQARMNSFKGQLNSLKGSVQALMITAMTPFMNNVLRPIITQMIAAVNAVTAWVSENEVLTQKIVTLLAVIVGLGPVIMIIGQAIMFVGGAMAFWLSPLGLVIAAIGGLVFIFRDRLFPIIQRLQNIFSADGGGFARLFAQFEDGSTVIGSFLEQLGLGADVAQRFGWAITGAIRGVWIMLSNFMSDLRTFGLGDAILSIFGRGQGSGGESTLEGLFARMGFSREAAIRMTNDIFTTFSLWFTRIQGLFNRISNAVTPAFREISRFFSGNSGGIVQFGQRLFGIGINLIRMASPIRILSRLLNFLGIDLLAIFETVANRVAQFFWGLNQGLSVVESLRLVFNNSALFNGLLNGFQAVASFITDTALPALIRFRDFFVALWDAFQQSGFSGAATFIQDKLITPLINGFNNIDWSQVGTNILTGLGTALATAATWATWVSDNILSPMITTASTAIASIDWSQVGTNILNAIGLALTTAFNFVLWLNDHVLSPLVNNAATAIASIDWFAVGEGIVNAIGAIIQLNFDFIRWLLDNILTPITNNTDAATGAIDWIGVGQSILNAIGSALMAQFNFIVWLVDNVLTPLVAGAASAIAEIDWGTIGQGIMDGIANTLPNIIQWVQTNIIDPIRNALSNFNPLESVNTAGTSANQLGGIANAVTSGQATPGQVLGAFGREFRSAFGFARGTNFVSNDMVANIHQGEAVIPAANNPFNPNASSPFLGSGGGGTTIGDIHINLGDIGNMTPADAQRVGTAAGRGFKDELHRRGLRS